MSEPDYPKEKYEDNPPMKWSWRSIYWFVSAFFVLMLVILQFFPTWF